MGYKEELISSGIFKRVNNYQYRCNCPFCGDLKGHMYVLIRMDDTPVLYNCFKCNAHGKMNKKFLEYFGIDNIKIPFTSKKKIIESKTSSNANIETVSPNDDITNICEYIQSRVGHYPTLSELQSFQYISNPELYAKDYFGKTNINKTLFNRYWFRLTNGNIIGRYIDDTKTPRWLKYNHITNSKGLYTIKNPFDAYKTINVYIAEGIMDVIGLYYNYIQNNNIYIATLGRNYADGLNHLISMGIFGDSVCVKIFKDSDFSKIWIDDHTRQLFKRIDIYGNMSAKDYGVTPDKLDIHKVI